MSNPAALRLRLSPEGRILPEPSDHPDRLAATLLSSTSEGLVLLAGCSVGDPSLSPEAHYWREFALRVLHDLCRLGDGVNGTTAPADPVFLMDSVLRAPEMAGAEYLSPAVLVRLWDQLALHALEAAARAESLRAWLSRTNPALHTVGRVTFHLAENKRDPDRPFAFMATYVERLSAAEQPVHIPLGRALQTYAGAANQAALKSLLEPVQRAAASSAFVRELLESRRVFTPQAWSPGEAYGFLREVPSLENSGLIVRIPNWWRGGKGPRAKVRVSIGEKAPSGVGLNALLDFRMEASFDGQPLTPEEWNALATATKGLVLLRGQWVEVDSARLSEALEQWKQLRKAGLGRGVDLLAGMRLLAGFRPEADGEADGAVPPEWSEVVAGDWLRERLDALRDPCRLGGEDPGRLVRATLRPYQVEGVRWLRLLQQLGLGACLADDMGLGKTLQVITLLAWLKTEAADDRLPSRPSLLVAPASLLANWRAEVLKFAPDLRIGLAHPSGGDEDGLDDRTGPPWAETLDLVVTTYGQTTRLKWLSTHTWRLVVLDEAQAIKNAGTKQTRAVKGLKGDCRIALSGTPVENRLSDLWSLFDFLNPGLLGGEREFSRYAGALRNAESPDYTALRRVVRPYILRRMKTDKRVIADLPDKTEVTAHCGLGRKQAALYQSSVDELKQRLEDAGDPVQRRGVVLAFLTRFKQICNHPSHWLGDQSFDPAESGKFARLREIIEEIAARQEKVLVFTQYQEMTAPLAALLARLFGRAGLVLHGGTPVSRRQEMVVEFQSEAGPPFFVLSLKAGGTGLNLTAASHVVHFDRWWNPAVENQATDRAFRIGQRRNVLVHKFVCKGTVEERIDQMIRDKTALADAVLGGSDGAAALLTKMDNGTLIQFVSLDLKSATGE